MFILWSLKRRRLRFHNLNLRLICFKTQLRKCKKGVGLCCTHNPYSMILVTNLTLLIHKVNLLCASMNALFMLNGFLARMLSLLVAGTLTTHLALHNMLVLMHVARLMITREHGTQISYCPWGFSH
jgi:hypothetical protein